MIERLYNLVDKGKIQQFKDYSKYVVNVNEEIGGMVEYNIYRRAIDKITSAAVSLDYKKLDEAKESIDLYKKFTKYLNNGIIFYK